MKHRWWFPLWLLVAVAILFRLIPLGAAESKRETYVDVLGTHAGEPVTEGAYFIWEDRYVAPPYVVKRIGRDIYVNEYLVRAGPDWDYSFKRAADPSVPAKMRTKEGALAYLERIRHGYERRLSRRNKLFYGWLGLEMTMSGKRAARFLEIIVSDLSPDEKKEQLKQEGISHDAEVLERASAFQAPVELVERLKPGREKQSPKRDPKPAADTAGKKSAVPVPANEREADIYRLVVRMSSQPYGKERDPFKVAFTESAETSVPVLKDVVLCPLWDSQLRTYVARMLADIPGTQATEALTTIFRQADKDSVAWLAAESLAGRPGAETDGLQLRPFAGVKRAPKGQVLRTLTLLKAVRAAPEIAECLSDESAYTRQAAADTLGALGVTNYVGAIRPLLQDPDQAVNAAALLALLRLGDEKALAKVLPALERTGRWTRRRDLIDALLRRGVPGLNTLLRIYEAAPWVSKTTIEMLAERSTDEIGASALRAIAEHPDISDERRAAARALADPNRIVRAGRDGLRLSFAPGDIREVTVEAGMEGSRKFSCTVDPERYPAVLAGIGAGRVVRRRLRRYSDMWGGCKPGRDPLLRIVLQDGRKLEIMIASWGRHPSYPPLLVWKPTPIIFFQGPEFEELVRGIIIAHLKQALDKKTWSEEAFFRAVFLEELGDESARWFIQQGMAAERPDGIRLFAARRFAPSRDPQAFKILAQFSCSHQDVLRALRPYPPALTVPVLKDVCLNGTFRRHETRALQELSKEVATREAIDAMLELWGKGDHYRMYLLYATGHSFELDQREECLRWWKENRDRPRIEVLADGQEKGYDSHAIRKFCETDIDAAMPVLLHRLRTRRGKRFERIAKRLKQLTGLDLGLDREAWLHWGERMGWTPSER